MDNQLLLQLYKRQSNIIYGYLLKNGCQKEEAEDIVQESFVKAIKHMEGVANEKLPSWLFKVAINEFKNRLKKQKKVLTVDLNEADFSANLADDTDFSEKLLLDETKAKVKTCLDSLKELHKQLLIMKYAMELSYKEIALLLGINENIVKTYLYRARKEFEKEWKFYE